MKKFLLNGKRKHGFVISVEYMVVLGIILTLVAAAWAVNRYVLESSEEQVSEYTFTGDPARYRANCAGDDRRGYKTAAIIQQAIPANDLGGGGILYQISGPLDEGLWGADFNWDEAAGSVINRIWRDDVAATLTDTSQVRGGILFVDNDEVENVAGDLIGEDIALFPTDPDDFTTTDLLTNTPEMLEGGSIIVSENGTCWGILQANHSPECLDKTIAGVDTRFCNSTETTV